MVQRELDICTNPVRHEICDLQFNTTLMAACVLYKVAQTSGNLFFPSINRGGVKAGFDIIVNPNCIGNNGALLSNLLIPVNLPNGYHIIVEVNVNKDENGRSNGRM